MTTRRKRPSSDAYLDDDPLDENGLLKDGRTYRVPLMLADTGAFIVDSHATPPSRPAPQPTHYRYGRGYLSDVSTGYVVDLRDDATKVGLVDARAPRSPTQVGASTLRPAVSAKPYTPLPRGEAFPTQSGGTWPAYNNQIGAPCECEDGREGRLAPHPSTSSMLICEPARQGQSARQ
jgi:hypothetical protein